MTYCYAAVIHIVIYRRVLPLITGAFGWEFIMLQQYNGVTITCKIPITETPINKKKLLDQAHQYNNQQSTISYIKLRD